MNPNVIQKFMQFAQTYQGNPQQQIQNMLNSGQITQTQYDNAVQTARQLQQMLPPSAHRR